MEPMETLIIGNLYRHYLKQERLHLLLDVKDTIVIVYCLTFDERVEIPIARFRNRFLPIGDNT